MKKFNNLSIFIVSAALVLTNSCSKTSTEDTKPPVVNDVTATISVTSGGGTVSNNGYAFIDDSVLITVTCTGTSDNKLARVKLTSSDSTIVKFDTILSGTSYTRTFLWTGQNQGSIITLNASVTGSNGSLGSASHTFTVTDIGSSVPVIGNQSYTEPYKRLWSFYNPQTKTYGMIYNLNEVASNIVKPEYIDIMYASRATYGVMMSPFSASAESVYGAAGNWMPAAERVTYWYTKRNATKFYITSIKPSEFTALFISNSKSKQSKAIDDAVAKYTNGADTAVLALSSFSQVFLFKTQTGQYGLINIISVSGVATGTSVSDGELNFSSFFRE